MRGNAPDLTRLSAHFFLYPSFIHSKGVCHRDLKLENIVLQGDPSHILGCTVRCLCASREALSTTPVRRSSSLAGKDHRLWSRQNPSRRPLRVTKAKYLPHRVRRHGLSMRQSAGVADDPCSDVHARIRA